MDVDDPKTIFKNSVAFSARTGWQTEAWEKLDSVGELRYYVTWRASACSKVRLIASELDEQGQPTGKCSNEDVNDIMSSIGGGALGVSQLVKRSVEILTVAGECWQAILYLPDSPPSGSWFAFSRDEIKRKGQQVTVELPTGADHVLGPDDTMWRVWNPHARRAKECDSPVRASLDALREVVRTTRKIRNADNSRLLSSGILFLPTEMSLPMAQAPVGADKPAGSPTPTVLTGAPAVQELSELIWQVAEASYKDENSHAALVPIMATVPAELIDKVQHLTWGQDFADSELKKRNDAIARLALGLEISPERLLGLGGSTNHWSAWTIGDNDVVLHIEPAMEMICQPMTVKVFQNALIAKGIDPTKYVVWYDASKLTADPDNSDNATEAFDRGVITADAYREFLNLGDTGYDLLDGGMEEWKRWAVDKISQDPTWLVQLMPLLDPALQELEFPVMIEVEAPTAGSGSDSQDGEAPDGADETAEPKTEDNKPGQDQGKRGRPKDVAANQAIVELLVGRALELATKRRRTRNDRLESRLGDLPLHHAHRIMGPVADADVAKLISGWDSTLEQDTLALVGLDIDTVRTEVRRQVHRQLTAQVVDA